MGAHPTPLAPAASKGHYSVAHLDGHWFIACPSRELGRGPVAAKIQGVPLVLFRGEGGRPGALEDRCPHRNAPLTAGRVIGGQLQCAYHGWRFDGGGACRAVPGLPGEPEARATRATAFATRELDGFIWVYSTPGAEPSAEPFRFPHLGDRRYTSARRSFFVASTLLAALENTLDVPHTAFLHGGLFRTARKENEIEVVVRRWSDRTEAEFIGEPRPRGLAGRVLAPGGGVVVHHDRFLLPSIAQVEYRLGDASHLVVTTAMTPVSDFETRLYAVVTFRLPVPGWLVRPFVTPIATHIFKQDARILTLQTENTHRFGGERFANTEIDVLGPQIWRLLKQAERGETTPPAAAAEYEHRLRMRV
ncbi:MAG TPA: aromatic ring-hydroxylating dioxygenase subunit alpha [Myxococcales bacterium]|nr:aromatic ring-hydroxylating dioxygenase subunit alpha [Myxococcales bacterium]